MLAGHVGAALAIGRLERRVNVGVFVLAALLLDVLLWLFVLCGWESVTIPANFADTHVPRFEFPYSHGLLPAVGWALLAGIVAFLWNPSQAAGKLRAAAFVAGAVLSHWLLDALVHSAGLPLAGAGSRRVGLGLWTSMPFALALEAVIVAAGLGWFLRGVRWPRTRKLILSAAVLAVLILTLLGMTIAPPPPSAAALAGSSLLIIAAVCGLAGWLGRRPGAA